MVNLIICTFFPIILNPPEFQAFNISYPPPVFIRYYDLNEKVKLDFGSTSGVTLFEMFTSSTGTLNFPWMKFLSEFEMKNIDSEKLRSNLCEDGVLLEKEQKKLKEFVKENLDSEINNEKLRFLFGMSLFNISISLDSKIIS